MIKKFFKNHKIHGPLAKYFDLLFLVNLPYFFVLWAVFFWGMGTSYYTFGIKEGYYFLTSFNFYEFLFFSGIFLFLSSINIQNQIDNLSIIDWTKKMKNMMLI